MSLLLEHFDPSTRFRPKSKCTSQAVPLSLSTNSWRTEMMCRRRLFVLSVLLATFFGASLLWAQEQPSPGHNDIYAGYGFLSSSFNDYSEFTGGVLNGWD